MSKMKQKENFYRICTAIVDHGKVALVMLLQNDMEKRNESFEQFINRNQHEIHHLCFNIKLCCQCGGRVPTGTPRYPVLRPPQFDMLFDTTRKFRCCKAKGNSKCCNLAKPGLTVRDLDVTLLRCLIVNFVPDYATQITVRHAVDDLIDYRNKLYGHAESGEMTDGNYKQKIKCISDVLIKIAEFCGNKSIMEEKLNTLKTLPYTEELDNRYRKKLIKEEEEIRNNLKEMKKLKRKMSEVGDTVGDIKISMGEMLYERREADKILFREGGKIVERLESVEKTTSETSESTILRVVGGGIVAGITAVVGGKVYDYLTKPSTSDNNRS